MKGLSDSSPEIAYLAGLLQKLKPSEREAIISYYLGAVPRLELERQTGLSEARFLKIRASLKRQYSQFQLRLGCERAERREDSWYGWRTP